MPFIRDPFIKAQTMLEYLIVMVVIAAVVFGAFGVKEGGFLDKTRISANSYFDTGAAAIMGGYYESGGSGTTGNYIELNPAPINGGWCQGHVVNGRTVRECACPRPAFGGAACSGEAVY
jgi:hypothetical protein